MTKRLSEAEKLLRKLKRQSAKANKRLRELHRTYKNETWSEKNLYARLGAKGTTKSGLIKANKKMSEAEIRNSLKAVEQFLKDKRSTVKGLENVKERMKSAFKDTMETEYEFSAEEADALYQLFEDESYAEMLKYFSPSEIFALIREATVKGISNEKDFINMFRNYIDFTENKGIRKTLSNFYKTYYKKR